MSIKKTTRDKVILKYHNRCADCGELLTEHYMMEDPETHDMVDIGKGYQIHHVDPRAKGGSDDVDNLVPLCLKCHARRHGDNDMILLGRLGIAKSNTKSGRRPRHITEGEEDIFRQYLFCRIGQEKAKYLLGCPDSSQKMSQMKAYNKFRKANGVVRSENRVDMYDRKNTFLENGTYVGFIEFQSGDIERLIWDETRGCNNVITTKEQEQENEKHKLVQDTKDAVVPLLEERTRQLISSIENEKRKLVQDTKDEREQIAHLHSEIEAMLLRTERVALSIQGVQAEHKAILKQLNDILYEIKQTNGGKSVAIKMELSDLGRTIRSELEELRRA